MSNYKEIVTKAVIGKGKKYFKNKYSVKSEVVPSTILGCWIINHKFKGYVQGDDVVVDGSFDINIWYSYDNDTIDFDIEKELGIEVVGDTKVKIMVEDDEDKWEVFDDNVTDETLEEIDNEVNEDFLE